MLPRKLSDIIEVGKQKMVNNIFKNDFVNFYDVIIIDEVILIKEQKVFLVIFFSFLDDVISIDIIFINDDFYKPMDFPQTY